MAGRTATIERTGDGTQTLCHPLFGDTYHSVRGAEGESAHVFIRGGLEAWLAAHPGARRVRMFEVGFGSGLNALLTARRAAGAGVGVEYHAVELYPVPREVWSAMDYAADPLFTALHEARWDALMQVAPYMRLKKMACDLADAEFGTTFDVVYMDAFAPDTQPELWTPEVFGRLYAATAPGGMLVTYSAAGGVKRALRAAGYEVHRLPGALGKRHMLRALKRGI